MKRSKALVVLTSQIRHVCPYKGQDQILALCYKRAQDLEERDFCYGCDHVDVLKHKFGLRTFRRKARFSRCRHCHEGAALHADAPPYASLRDSRCPGFEPDAEDGVLWVALDSACTQWMIVDASTGKRMTLAEYKGDRRYRLPLVGAPGTVPADWRDEIRREAASFAATKRRLKGKREDDTEEETTTVRVKGARRSKKKS